MGFKSKTAKNVGMKIMIFECVPLTKYDMLYIDENVLKKKIKKRNPTKRSSRIKDIASKSKLFLYKGNLG